MTERALSTIDTRAIATRFQSFGKLSVRQRKNWLEILLSFETKNQYEVFDETGQAVFKVQEVGEGFVELIKRMMLSAWRPFTAEVRDVMSGEAVLVLKRPWRWIFHRLEVFSGSGERLGAIEKEWSWFRRIYTIEGPDGAVVAQLFGPILKPWTFEIRDKGARVGVIQKKWSGWGKELFTDADNFGVDLQNISDANLKALAFAATVLIDVVHFERSKNN